MDDENINKPTAYGPCACSHIFAEKEKVAEDAQNQVNVHL